MNGLILAAYWRAYPACITPNQLVEARQPYDLLPAGCVRALQLFYRSSARSSQRTCSPRGPVRLVRGDCGKSESRSDLHIPLDQRLGGRGTIVERQPHLKRRRPLARTRAGARDPADAPGPRRRNQYPLDARISGDMDADTGVVHKRPDAST